MILKSGEKFIDKYVERKRDRVKFEEAGSVPTADIRAISIYDAEADQN